MTFSDATRLSAKFLFHTDVYKWGHVKMYPEDTKMVFSNYTNRMTRIPGVNKVVNFGLDGFLTELYTEYFKFLDGDIDQIVEYYKSVVANVLGGEVEDPTHFRDLHAYGNANDKDLPIRFLSLPQGAEVPLRVPSFVFYNSHPMFSWLTNYIETWLSASVWHPSTVATKALHFRRLLNKWAIETTGSTDGVGFQGHDFSYRGLPGTQAAGASGAAHLLAFDGSDNLETFNYLNETYVLGDPTEDFVLGSVLASEHSVMCAGTAVQGEYALYERLLTENPNGIISLVSDTYDLWNVIENFLPKLKDLIMGRDGKLVIRPDSGDPVDIICGTAAPGTGITTDTRTNTVVHDARTTEEKGVIELLWDIFGGTVNEQGYKVLDSHIGAIYGDSITYERAEAIMQRLKDKGFASTNVVFGVGSYTYQYVTRDTFGSAVKATAVVVGDDEHQIFKDPATDNGTKKSARGFIRVIKNEDGEYEMVDGLTKEELATSIEDETNELKLVRPGLGSYAKTRELVRENM